MNFNNTEYSELPFILKSYICFIEEGIEYKIAIEFKDDIQDKYLIETFSNNEYNRYSVNTKHNNTTTFTCELANSYFMRIQVIDNVEGYLYYGFYQFDMDSIPNVFKKCFVDHSEEFSNGLTLLIKDKINYNYKDFDNLQYPFVTINDHTSCVESDDHSDDSKKSNNISENDDSENDDSENINGDSTDNEKKSISNNGESSDDDIV